MNKQVLFMFNLIIFLTVPVMRMCIYAPHA